MVTRRLLALLLLTIVTSAATAACERVIGLGEEPKLKEPSESSKLSCGLPAAQNLACTECLASACCEEAETCSADPACADAASNCLPNCWELGCVSQCLEPFGPDEPLIKLATCGIRCQSFCTPAADSDCYSLADECCRNIEDSTLRRGCVDTALKGDDTECNRVRLTAESARPPLCAPR